MFLGMLVGGYVWGSLGDMYGRRKTLIVAMGSVQQSRLSSQFEFHCCNFPQLLDTQKNVQFHLNLHFNLQFTGVQNWFEPRFPFQFAN